MNFNKKRFNLPVILALLLCLAACGQNGDNSLPSSTDRSTAGTSASVTTSTNTSSTSSEISDTTITYETNDEVYTEGGITAKYPQLVNANDKKKADCINKAIQDDMRSYVDSLKADSKEAGKLTLDLKYEISGYKDKVLSITYTGLSSTKGAVYPVNVYHSVNIDLRTCDFVPLKSLFKIDSSFVQAFLSGMYSPYTSDLDLEKSGVDLKETISNEYSEKELVEAFSKVNVNFRLADQGVIVSIEVPHAIGDHLEMAINYESIESNILKENPIWKDYLFIIDSSDGSYEKSVAYKTYSNARFDFQLSYPDVFTSSNESDNGDGISLETADGSKTLQIWGSNNINEATGAALLKDAKTRVSHILSETSDKKSYTIEYEGGGDGTPIIFHEYGYIAGNIIICYIFSYPEDEKDSYSEVINKMTAELKVN